MRVILTGVSHKSAPVEIRERLAVSGEHTASFLRSLCDAAELSEAAILSTCNRTELYAVPHTESWQERILDFSAAHSGVRASQLQPHLYCFEGSPAARHLFRVASGLDSMILGEAQIQAQVKEALRLAREAGTAGTAVGGLFQHALQTGKRARGETEITRGAVSVSLAAVEMARQIFGRLQERRAMVVGAGKAGEQTARLLLSAGVSTRIMVCNRTYQTALQVAERLGGTPLTLDQLPEGLKQADIVISSTGSMRPVITRALLRPVMRERRGRPVFLIDIAVPRDIEPAAGDLENVYLYNIDDLQDVVHKNLAVRQSEVEKVEAIIEAEVRAFQGWLRGLEVGPTIAQLQHEIERIRAAELDRLGSKLSHLSERDRSVIDAMLRGVANKILHRPIMHLRKAAASGNGYHEVESVRAIFGLAATGDGGRGTGDGGPETGAGGREDQSLASVPTPTPTPTPTRSFVRDPSGGARSLSPVPGPRSPVDPPAVEEGDP